MSDHRNDEDDFADEPLDYGQDDASFDPEDAGGEYFEDSGEFSDEEWSEGEMAEEAPQEKKKRSGLGFNTIVIMLAVVAGLVFTYIKISQSAKKSSPQVTHAQASQGIPMMGARDNLVYKGSNEAVKSALPAASAQPSAVKPQQGFLTNPEMLGKPEAQDNLVNAVPRGPEDAPHAAGQPEVVSDAPPMPAPLSPVESPTDHPDKAAMPAPLPGEPVQEALKPSVGTEPLTPMPQMDLPPAGELSAPAKSAAQEASPLPVQAEPVKAAKAPDLDAPVTAIPAPDLQKAAPLPSSMAQDKAENAANADLDKKLSMIADQLDALQDKVANLSTANADLSGLKSTVENLQQKVDALSQGQRKPSAASAAPAPKAAAAAPARVSRPKPTASSVRIKAEPRKHEAPVQWELRAAQPGKAWVAKSGESDMQSLEVGSTLPGLGRVTGISYMDGKWVVEGTQGRIEQ